MIRQFDSTALVRSFIGVSGLYMLGIPLLLIANIVLARALSVADFGAFSFALSLATVLAIPVSGGLPMLLTREVASYSQKGNWSAYRGLVRVAYTWVVAVSLVVGLAFLAWKILAASLPSQQLLIAFLLVPFLGLNAIRNGILKGLGRPMLAEAPNQVIQPSLMIVGYLLLAWLGLASATHALWWYLAVVVVVFVLASIILWKVQPGPVSDTQADITDLPRWKQAILPFVLMSAATVMSTQMAVLMLGFAGMEEAVAQMRVAERGAQLVAFPLSFLNSVIGPYFVQALSASKNTSDNRELRKMARHSALLTLAASLPLALVLILFGRALIGWTFGMPYDAESYLPMVILIGAQLLSVALGNGGMLMAMGGYERQTLYSLILSLGVILTISGWLIVPYGATGAAIGVGGGIIVSKIYVYFAVRRWYGISSGIF